MPTSEDTKVCPYCAETIKAAAIKCRYCQSDLTDGPAADPPPTSGFDTAAAPAAQPAPEAEPVPPAAMAEPEVAEGDRVETPFADEWADEHAPAARSARRPLWVVVPLVVSVVAGLVLAGLAFRDWRSTNRVGDSAEAAKAVQATAADKVKTLLSYTYSSIDADEAAAVKLLTPTFKGQYEPTIKEIKDRAVQQQRSQTADVVAVAVISATPDEVSTLMFVNTTSSTEASSTPDVTQNRIKVTFVKDGSTWLINDVTVPSS